MCKNHESSKIKIEFKKRKDFQKNNRKDKYLEKQNDSVKAFNLKQL